MRKVEARTNFVVENTDDREQAVLVCTAVLEVLRPSLGSAVVDAYSDHADKPSAAAQAEIQLRQRGAKRESGDPGMAVEIELDEEGWDLVLAYAPWSINVELIGIDGSDLATLHDCGRSVVADLTDEEAATLRQRLAEVSAVTSLGEHRERRRQARRRSSRRR